MERKNEPCHFSSRVGNESRTAYVRRFHTYRLKFVAEKEKLAKQIEFEAPNVFRALKLAHSEARKRPIELWLDGHKVCSLTELNNEVWLVAPSSS